MKWQRSEEHTSELQSHSDLHFSLHDALPIYYYIQQEDMRSNRPAISQIYQAYAARCFKNGAMDFDDLLLKFYELLKNVPESLSKYQRKFKYILIDEMAEIGRAHV